MDIALVAGSKTWYGSKAIFMQRSPYFRATLAYIGSEAAD